MGQNEDTYKILNEMGMAYDAGFQSVILFINDHEADTWPYLIPGHKLYAVPLSLSTSSGEKTVEVPAPAAEVQSVPSNNTTEAGYVACDSIENGTVIIEPGNTAGNLIENASAPVEIAF